MTDATENGTRLIVAGTRSIKETCGADAARGFVWSAIDASPFAPTEIVSGTADGADALGEEYADEHGIDVEPFPADWGRLGSMAGPKRNSEMAAYADAAVIVRVDGSSGSTDMINKAERHLGEESTFVVDIDTAAAE